MSNKLALMIFVLLVSLNFISAENDDFRIGNIEIKTSAEYQDGYAVMKVRIDSLNSVCRQECTWSATGGDAGSFTLNANPDYKPLEFNSNAISGQGYINGVLEVTCIESNSLCGSADSDSKQFSHNYTFLGDNLCTTSNNHENCVLALGDCPCTTSGTSCKNSIGSGQWEGRIPDDRQCVTYCGNGVKESSYETCSSCPIDIGRCDGYVGCTSGNECEGGFCVHETCWNKAWREGDNLCDLNQGENCKNSQDCGCGNNGLCSNAGICEKPESNKEEIIKAVESGVQETLETSKSRQKNVTIGAIVLIFLVIIGYLFYKFSKDKKANKSKPIKKGKKK